MSKKLARKTKTAQSVSIRETAAALEIATLKRLDNQQRRIVALSRALTRSVRKADVVRVTSARALCEGTGWDVFDVEEVQSRAQLVERLRDENTLIRGELRRLDPEHAAAKG